MGLDKKQQEAFNHAINNEITFINGFAGSGKSYTALEIEKELIELGWKIEKVAPTGKAAIRIGGRTIHSWLEPIVEGDDYGNVKIIGFDKVRLNDNTCLIVDESSMIDNDLWVQIMRVWNNSTGQRKIIFVGDGGQLEPVGDGTPFIDNLGKENTITLDEAHRQADGNDINDFANAIRSGKSIDWEPKNVKTLTMDEALKKASQDIKNIQFVAPMKKGDGGVDSLNKRIQDIVGFKDKAFETLKWKQNEYDGKWKLVKDKDIYIGDKIVITKNMPNLNAYNGTVGIVVRKGVEPIMDYRLGFKKPTICFYIDTGDEEIFIPFSDIQKNSDLAYCLTVHKVQGSQYKEVLFSATPDQGYMLGNKKLVYTALTRAVEKVWVINGQ